MGRKREQSPFIPLHFLPSPPLNGRLEAGRRAVQSIDLRGRGRVYVRFFISPLMRVCVLWLSHVQPRYQEVFFVPWYTACGRVVFLCGLSSLLYDCCVLCVFVCLFPGYLTCFMSSSIQFVVGVFFLYWFSSLLYDWCVFCVFVSPGYLTCSTQIRSGVLWPLVVGVVFL